MAAAAPGGFASYPAAKILPFCEPMGRWGQFGQKEFSWEREWRHVGNFHFLPSEVALVFCPESEIAEFEAGGRYRAVDPSWSLERMVDHLRRPPRVRRQPGAAPFATTASAGPIGARPPIIVVDAEEKPTRTPAREARDRVGR